MFHWEPTTAVKMLTTRVKRNSVTGTSLHRTYFLLTKMWFVWLSWSKLGNIWRRSCNQYQSISSTEDIVLYAVFTQQRDELVTNMIFYHSILVYMNKRTSISTMIYRHLEEIARRDTVQMSVMQWNVRNILHEDQKPSSL